ncbi:hypothetical protein ABT275_39320 [Streptomyces sp. NPDC001185]
MRGRDRPSVAARSALAVLDGDGFAYGVSTIVPDCPATKIP